MAAPVVHFEILGKDENKLKDFYKNMFDWEIDSNYAMNYAIVKKADKGIGGGIGSTQEGQPPLVTFYVEVDDVQEYLDKIEDSGGKTILPVTEIPNTVTFAHFADPEGNIIGLVKSE